MDTWICTLAISGVLISLTPMIILHVVCRLRPRLSMLHFRSFIAISAFKSLLDCISDAFHSVCINQRINGGIVMRCTETKCVDEIWIFTGMRCAVLNWCFNNEICSQGHPTWAKSPNHHEHGVRCSHFLSSYEIARHFDTRDMFPELRIKIIWFSKINNQFSPVFELLWGLIHTKRQLRLLLQW